MLARKIREELELIYGPQYQEYLDLVGKLREDVIRNVQDPKKKERYLKALPLTEFSASSKKAGLLR